MEAQMFMRLFDYQQYQGCWKRGYGTKKSQDKITSFFDYSKQIHVQLPKTMELITVQDTTMFSIINGSFTPCSDFTKEIGGRFVDNPF